MNTKHTPGPWKTQSLASDGIEIIDVATEKRVAFVALNGFNSFEKSENAHLIAAAPELLEACMTAIPAVVALVERLRRENMQTALIAAETTRNMLQSAITKATIS